MARASRYYQSHRELATPTPGMHHSCVRIGHVLLATGGLVVVGAGIALMMMLREAPAKTTAGTTTKTPTVEAAPGTPETPRVATGPTPAPTAKVPAGTAASPGLKSEPRGFVNEDDEEPAPDIGSDGRPIPITEAQPMRAEVAKMAPQMDKCLEGKTLTGKALLQFEVRPRKGKVIVETMGYNDEQTDIQDKALLDCFEKTTELLRDKFPYQKNTTGIFVRRSIKVENGKLTENWITWFSYLRRG